MVRCLILAVLFCLSAWAVTDRTSADRADRASAAAAVGAVAADAAMASVGPTVATPPIDTHPPEARWEALLPGGIGGGSSRHQLQQLQAIDLPGISSRAPWPVAHRASAARQVARSLPPHLHDIPLLI